MLAAADSSACSFRPPHDLGHQPERVASASEEVPVTAVVGKYVIVIAEMFDDGNRIGLLADTGMRRPVEQASLKQLEQAFFEPADESHPAVQSIGTRLAWHSNQSSVRPLFGRREPNGIDYHHWRAFLKSNAAVQPPSS
jgi:hypothetical protein